MKSMFKSVGAGIIVCVLNGTLLAQAQPGQIDESKTGAQTIQAQSSTQVGTPDYQQLRKYLDMTGRPSRDAQNRSMGLIDHIVARSPESAVAEIALANGRYVMVPWTSLDKEQNRGGETLVRINSTAEQISSGPTIAGNDWQKADVGNPQFIQSLYAHYNIPGKTETAVGAAEASGSGTIKDSGGSNPTEQK